ncbi:nuclease-related domain-containing protein [Clostridium massiliamazoniense]|uniref:nuclease-related domain-containing protein n=1 Tax=Clostridium massiliamazoniense TaxID=1347366 RepID=UPI0011C8C7E6|nr:nuclease-related domain-containing protein [Clostridium massiliamazoniense]
MNLNKSNKLISIIKKIFRLGRNKKENSKETALDEEIIKNNALFIKNYLNNLEINPNYNFEFTEGYKVSRNENYHYFTLEEKKVYMDQLFNAKYIEKLQALSHRLNLARTHIEDIRNKNNNKIPFEKSYTLSKLIKSLSSFENLTNSRIKYMKDSALSSTLGLDGERIVNNKLDIHSNLINLKNIRLQDDLGRSCQCDNIVISKRGKNIEVVSNPVEQNNMHIAILNRILNNTLNKDVSAHGVVVIANDTVNIINESKDIIVRPSSIYNILDNEFENAMLSEADIQYISSFINSSQLEEKKYPVFSIEKEFDETNIEKIDFLISKCYSSVKVLIQQN